MEDRYAYVHACRSIAVRGEIGARSDGSETHNTQPGDRREQLLVLRSTKAQISLMVQFESQKVGTLLQGKSNHCLR